MHNVVINNEKPAVSPATLEVGQIAVVVESGSQPFNEFLGHVVLRNFSGLCSLTRPRNTWSDMHDSWPDFKVRAVPAGTKITITVGE